MRIRLLRKWGDYEIGRVMEVFDPKAKELICDRVAEKYDGEYPPQGKMKTEFFKPIKKDKRWQR